MTYNEGLVFIKSLFELHKASDIGNIKTNLSIGNIRIETPGYKKNGDYKVLLKIEGEKNLVAYSHADIVNSIYKNTTLENALNIINGFECLFLNGLNSQNTFFNSEYKNLLFWLTLQEDLNYPMDRYQGRKLPFQRYYEAILAKLGYYSLNFIIERTNNHGGGRPNLLNIPDEIKRPVFYDLNTAF